MLLSPLIIQSKSSVPASAVVPTSNVKLLELPVTSTLKSELSIPYVFVGSPCIVKLLLSPSNSKKPVMLSPRISPKNLLVLPI